VFALVRGSDAFLSQHLGDLGDERAYRAWAEAVTHFSRLLEISPGVVAHDLHPGYRSTAYALSLEGLPRIPVQHHHAHIASCLVDNGLHARAKNPATTVPQTPLPNVTYGVGGVTIMAAGQPVGAIGVSGAPGGQFDEECARGALARIQDRIK